MQVRGLECWGQGIDAPGAQSWGSGSRPTMCLLWVGKNCDPSCHSLRACGLSGQLRCRGRYCCCFWCDCLALMQAEGCF